MKDCLGYKNKKCVVLGGSNGMGKACAAQLLEMGAEVYVLDLLPCDLEGVTYLEINMADRESIKNAFYQLPMLDKFFGWAGVFLPTDNVKTMAINALGYMFILDELLYDKMNENGAAVFTSSIAGEGWESNYELYRYALEHTYEETLDWAAGLDIGMGYVLSKMILNYYTMIKSIERYGKKWIRLNCIAPGLTKTRLRDSFAATHPDGASGISGSALKREAEPQEPAEVAIAINSDLFRFVTGDLTYVDGGHHASVMGAAM